MNERKNAAAAVSDSFHGWVILASHLAAQDGDALPRSSSTGRSFVVASALDDADAVAPANDASAMVSAAKPREHQRRTSGPARRCDHEAVIVRAVASGPFFAGALEAVSEPTALSSFRGGLQSLTVTIGGGNIHGREQSNRAVTV